MDFLKIFEDAILYIESNLENDDLSISTISNNLYISSFYFQRMFYSLSNKTVGSYIRERKLSKALNDLKQGEPILNVAIKYGYNTQESFSKAFKKFYGLSPKYYKNISDIATTKKIDINNIFIKGENMNYKIEKENEFDIVVIIKEFDEKNSNEEIPKFWDEYYQNNYDKLVPPMLGICLSKDVYKASDNKFGYGIGSLKEYCSSIPSSFTTLHIPSSLWAKFSTKGSMPDAIQNLWKEIYTSWAPSSQYEIQEGYDFECYEEGDSQSENYESGIWLMVKEK